MSYFFWVAVSYLFRAIFSVRYRVEVKGELKSKKGILFLPNHTSHLDPLFFFIWFWPKYRMRPLVVDFIYNLPWLKPGIKLVKGIEVPDFEEVDQLKLKRAKEALGEIATGLKKEDNFVLFPSGRLKAQGKEIVGGSSGAHDLVQGNPEANVVLVRISGFWGSSFSKALTGKSPDLAGAIWQGVKVLLKNGLFFAPRRRIYIELEAREDLPREASRKEFNRYLENWYNRFRDDEGKIYESEPLKLVSYSFWKKDLPEIAVPKKERSFNGALSISPATREKVTAEIQKILENPSLKITSEMKLGSDLGMDSLNVAELIAFLSQQYDVVDIHPKDLESVQDVLEIAEGERATKATVQGPKISWPEANNRPDPILSEGKIFPEVLLNSCKRMGSQAALGDDIVGIWDYKKLRKAVLVLAQYFRSMPEEKIAIMLPSSAAAYLTIAAVQCAGKVPVMLNWTLGPRYLEEMMAMSGAKRAISSKRFLERLSSVDFGKLVDQIEPLEEIRKKLTLKMKLRGLFLTFCPVSFVLRFMGLDRIQEDDPAVILFTSGAEATPKGVPLSHKNILSNMSACLLTNDFSANDVLVAFLPPFHSFGFTITGFLCIFSGLRISFFPNPTDGFALADGIDRWKGTIICGAPNFVRGILNAAKPEQLKMLRYIIVGAEKAPRELYEKVESLKSGAILLEGYGTTECSPVVTVNRFNRPPIGVGPLLSGFELCTIHPETQELLPEGGEGEICIHGPCVFNGYLGNQRSPFIEIRGKRWYRTGDIGHLDPEGNVILSDRLKRFTKVAGEMISLGAIEEVLVKELLRKGQISPDIPSLAICADERNIGKPQLVLFSTIPIDKESANEILFRSGFSRLLKISSVQKVDEIPVMGTGKTNYRQLQKSLV